MKRIIWGLLIIVSFFSFNTVVYAEEEESKVIFNSYLVEIYESYDKIGFEIVEKFSIYSDDDIQRYYSKTLSVNNTGNFRLNVDYDRNKFDLDYVYSFRVGTMDDIELSYFLFSSEDGYYILDFEPVQLCYDSLTLKYNNINIIIHSDNPALDSENFIFDPNIFDVELTERTINATIKGEITEFPKFTYKIKKANYSNSSESKSGSNNDKNPLKKYSAIFFACEVVTFIAFLAMYIYCYTRKEFLKFYMFFIYALSEILFMLYCASVCYLYYVALMMHVFYSLFFIGFLFAKSAKNNKLTFGTKIFFIVHSSAFLVLTPLMSSIVYGMPYFIGLMISSVMFYITLFSTSSMYNFGNPFANDKSNLLKDDSKADTVNLHGVEIYKSTVYNQFPKGDARSNYKVLLKTSPKLWFYFHSREFTGSLYVWFLAAIIAIFVVLPVGYLFNLHILYDICKFKSSLMLDVISFIIAFTPTVIVFLVIFNIFGKYWKFKKLYKNGALIKDIPCKIIGFEGVFKDDGYYKYKILCSYSIDGEEKEYISNDKKEYINNFPKTCDLLIDLDHPNNYYIDFVINREE